MKTPGVFSPRVLVRIAIYLAVIAVLFVVRSRREPSSPPEGSAPADSALVVAGASLAPGLVPAWSAGWARDYPTRVVAQPGGTNHALEALLSGRADVALLTRPPSAAENALLPGAPEDTLGCYPVAYAALLVLQHVTGGRTAVSCAELRALLDGPPREDERLWIADPNLGWWDALRSSLELPAAHGPSGSVRFLADAAAVGQATADDPGSLGVVSSLAWAPRPDVIALPVRPDGSDAPVVPSDASVAEGRYPLAHHLWAACRPRARGATAMFVTYLTSARGQRLVEREGFLPARRVAREVYLTTPSSPPAP